MAAFHNRVLQSLQFIRSDLQGCILMRAGRYNDTAALGGTDMKRRSHLAARGTNEVLHPTGPFFPHLVDVDGGRRSQAKQRDEGEDGNKSSCSCICKDMDVLFCCSYVYIVKNVHA